MVDEKKNERIKNVDKQGEDGASSISKPRPVPGSKKYRGDKEKKEIPRNSQK